MSLGTQEQRTEGMKKQAQFLIDQAYQRGYKAGQVNNQEFHESICDGCKKGFEDREMELIEYGRNEAWEAARTIIDFWFNVTHCDPNNFAKLFDIDAHLGDDVFEKFFEQFSASEAIERFHAYEEKKQKEDKMDYLSNFCDGRCCLECVLCTNEFECGYRYRWTTDPDKCGDVDKAYNLVKEYEEKKKQEEDTEIMRRNKAKVEALAKDIGLDQMMDILIKLNGDEK